MVIEAEGLLRTPEGQAALRAFLHEFWRVSGGEDMRWYGVYDAELQRVTAICANRELAELLLSKLNEVETPDEIRVLTYEEAQAALAAAQRERAELARFYGQHVPPNDLPNP